MVSKITATSHPLLMIVPWKKQQELGLDKRRRNGSGPKYFVCASLGFSNLGDANFH